MRDLVRSWFWAGGAAVVFSTLAGRSLSLSGTTGGWALAPLVLLLGAIPALAAGAAHPAPARGSIRRHLVAVMPWVLLPAVAGMTSAVAAGATAGVVLGALALTILGGSVGAVAGAAVVRPHPRRGVEWRPLRLAGSKRRMSYIRPAPRP